MRHPIARHILWLLILLALAWASWARSTPVQLAWAQEPVVPTAPPNAADGRRLFEQRCANCHGPTGGGDGELAANLPAVPMAFSNPAYRETAVPADMFATISSGRVSRGMPPFGPESSNPLSDEQRWALVATLFSLSTPAESVAQGQIVYEQNCLACHSADGRGNGSEAANLSASPTDLTNLTYWFTQSSASVATVLRSGSISAHMFTLTEAEQTAVVDYARTFSYGFVDLFAPLPPIEAATIGGQVVNGTRNESLSSGQVTLSAFTTDLDEALSLTAPIAANGRYTFDLSLIPPDWVYIATTHYNGTRFSSQVNQLSADQPALELPIVVYEATTEATAVSIEQLHLLLGFIEGKLQVNELYLFNNRAAAVFMGSTPEAADGTVEFSLPAGAENIHFQRTFDAFNSFMPANELIQTGTGWADTLPLHPGQGSIGLLVQYELPYTDGILLAHPLAYSLNRVSLILPDVGVAVADAAWLAQGTEMLTNGRFQNYQRDGLAAGEALALQLNGRPRLITNADGNLILVRHTVPELLIGGAGLLLALAVALFFFWRWQHPANVASLLQTVANLDDAYADGRLVQHTYQRQRAKLIARLKALWP